ncbi:hypothetical protein ACFL3V_03575 [Nanoarchaeota archaeon]
MNQTNQPKTTPMMYDPETVLVVMKPEQKELAGLVQKAIMDYQGISNVTVVSDEVSAISHINQNRADIVIAGYDCGSVVRYIEQHDRKGLLTLAVTQNGVPADVKLSSTKELTDFVQSPKLLREAYWGNEDAQTMRREGEYIARNLERRAQEN